MGYIWAIYYLYFISYLLLPFPVGYPDTAALVVTVVECRGFR